MIKAFTRFLQLLDLIFRHGKLRHSGYDFNVIRNEDLEGLKKLFGINYPSHSKSGLVKSWFWKNSITRNFLVQGAFTKQSFVKHGNHILLPHLKLAYIRIPKAASTSVGASLLQSLYPRTDLTKLSAIQINHLIDVHALHHAPSSDHNYFTVVRNPFERLVSVYQSVFENKSGSFLYQDYLFGIFDRDLSFLEFVKRLQRVPDRMKDQHLKPQYLFLEFYTKRNIPLTTLKLENLRAVTSFLENYNLTLPQINMSTSTSDYHTYYDTEAFKIVQKVYENDFKVLAYEAELIDLENFLSTKSA